LNHTPFDPKKAVTFDLPHGQVRLGDGSSDTGRAVIVPADALATIVRAAGDSAAQELGRALGRTLGARVGQRMSGADQVRAAPLETVAAELAAEVAMVGFGELSFERWGKALVAVVRGAPDGYRFLLAPLVEGLLSASTGRAVHSLTLTRDADPARILVARADSIDRVAGWLGEGVPWGDAITRLHASATGGAA
jgi:hypothetical protein